MCVFLIYEINIVLHHSPLLSFVLHSHSTPVCPFPVLILAHALGCVRLFPVISVHNILCACLVSVCSSACRQALYSHPPACTTCTCFMCQREETRRWRPSQQDKTDNNSSLLQPGNHRGQVNVCHSMTLRYYHHVTTRLP